MARKKKTSTTTAQPKHDASLLDDGIVDDDYAPEDEGGAPRIEETDAESDTETGLHAEAEDDEDEPASQPATPPAAPTPTPDRAYVDRNDDRATRYLKHYLTGSEVAVMRHEREEGDAEYERFDDELTAAQATVKSLKTKMEALSIRGRELSKTIRLGWEMRDVECIEERGTNPDPDSKAFGALGMRTVRLDTGEVIEWRELLRSERQGQLFDDPAPAPAPTATPAPASVQA